MNDKLVQDDEKIIKAKVEGEKKHKDILRNIILVNSFYRIFGTSFMFLLPLYGIDKGWTDAYYGQVIAIGGYAATGIIFILGILVDIQFKRTTLIIGVATTIVAAVLFTRVDVAWLSIVFYSLYAIGQQLLRLSTNTFIANETRKGDHRTKGFTANMFFSGIARTIAPVACGYLLLIPALNFDWVFTIVAVFGGISLILVITLQLAAEKTPEDEIDYAEDLSKTSGDESSIFEQHETGKKGIIGVQIGFGLGRMLMGFTSGVAIPFVSWYILNEFSPTDDVWGWVVSASWGMLTLGYLFMGYIAEKIGKDIIVVIFWTLVIPAAVGIMLAKSFFWASFFFVIRTFFAMTPSAAWNSFMFEWIQPRHRGKILGLLQTGQRGLRSTGTLIGGYVFSILGATIFPIAMIAYPIAGLLPLLISKSVKKKMREEEKELEEKRKEEATFESIMDDSIEIVGETK